MPQHQEAQDARARLARLARWVRLISALMAVLVLIVPPLFWAQPDWVAEVARRDWALGTVQLDSMARLGGLLAGLPASAMSLWALWQVWQLFGCFGRGELLSLRPARHLGRLGWALLMLMALLPLSDTLVRLALTLGNPAGQRQLVLGLSTYHLLCLLTGLVMLALSRVMREAARVADENAAFV